MTRIYDAKELQFGIRWNPPFPIRGKALWGARLIYHEVQEGGSGIVGDRQDGLGELGDRKLLLKKIEAKDVDGLLRGLVQSGRMPSSSATVETVYEDDEVAYYATPNRSYGYIYVTAILKEKESTCDSHRT